MSILFWLLGKLGVDSALAKILEPLLVTLLLVVSLLGTFYLGEYKEAAQWRAMTQEYRQQVQAVKNQAEAQLEVMSAANAKVVSDLSLQLIAEKKRQEVVQVQIKEVTKYVTTEADSHCVITAGAEQLLDMPLSTVDSGDATLPGSEPRAVDTPTGIALSTLVSTEAANLSECVLRGKVIDSWQEWYSTTSTNWERTRAGLPQAPVLAEHP